MTNNAFHLSSAIGAESSLAPAARLVRDGHHSGTLFCWDGDEWIVVNVEGKHYVGAFKRLAVVTLEPDGDEFQADNGLNQVQLGCDLDVGGGEWVVDADDLDKLRDIYGDNLTVLWVQE